MAHNDQGHAEVLADWNALGGIFYRKFELYSMGWSGQVNLSEVIVAAGSFGGPIALTRDDRKLTKVHGATSKPIVFIFSAAGKLNASFKWTSGRLVQLGWSCSEDLVCVQEDGTIQLYDLFGQFVQRFTVLPEKSEVIEAQVVTTQHTTGVVLLLSNFKFFVVGNIYDPRARCLPDIPGVSKEPNLCWTVVTEDRSSIVLVGWDNAIYVFERTSQSQLVAKTLQSAYLTDGIEKLAVSYNHRHVAVYFNRGVLWVGSSDLQKKYWECQVEKAGQLASMEWCGNQAIVLFWEPDFMLQIIGLNTDPSDWIVYTYDSPVHIQQELDGVRVISNSSHELLHKIPKVVTEIFRIGSMSPGAILLEAHREFQKRSHRADEYIRMIQDQLSESVMRCFEAAGHEYNPTTQKLLLRAASFGKAFISDFDPQPFVKTCQILRVLNSVRDFTIGMPVTFSQLQHLTIPVLLDRLMLRRYYCLAIRICQYLKYPDIEGASRILRHWACYKVKQTHLDSDQLARDIAEKLGYTPGISYSEIANKAQENGRDALAIKLLDFEPRASEQVPPLIKLKQTHQAMKKAIESGDSDLIYLVIQHMKETMKRDFSVELRKFPEAQALYLKYCRQQSLDTLADIHSQEDNFLEVANCRVVQAYQNNRTDNLIANLVAATDAFKKAKNDFAATHTESQIKLLRWQIKLEDTVKRKFLHQSLHETIFTLLLEGYSKEAEDIKKEFKVSDKRFWWLKIEALVEARDWAELDKFSRAKKSPIGYEPFVDVCLQHGHKGEAVKYVSRVQDTNRVRYLVKTEQLEEAVKLAFDLKDDQALLVIHSKCGANQKQLADRVQALRSQLASKR